MTKVLVGWGRLILLACCLLGAPPAFAQSPKPDAHCPQTAAGLYSRISSVGLDPARVYRVRDAAIDRPSLNLTLEDGTLAFTEDICGRITGAFFIGDGEILLKPPTRTERASLTLFTGMAILEEQFHSAYLRFNDDTADLLQPFLAPSQWTSDVFKGWDDASRRLAEYDSLRLFVDFSYFLPGSASSDAAQKLPSLLHLHLVGQKLGAFEVFWDAAATEPLAVGQLRTKDNLGFFDTWTSFAPPSAEGLVPARTRDDISIATYRIQATVQPPTELQALTDVDLRIHKGGQRTLLFELSRYLKVGSVELDGRSLDFIQNPAIEGTQLERRGNDLIAVIFPAELKAGQALKLHFRYAGDVLSDAGNGLVYVGARGTWYPSFGLSPASFDLDFRYPAAWTLVATGKRTSPGGTGSPTEKVEVGEKTSHWVSDRPIPLAGFNLGKYVHAEAKTGKVAVDAYSTKGVEKTFPKAPPEVVDGPDLPHPYSSLNPVAPIVVTPLPPSPAQELQSVADRAAKAIAAFSQWYGPYPYSSLAITQMPGDLSQGWPGLVFLSSFAFLSPQEQVDLKLDPITRVLNSQVLVHETAHQWWGDLVLWKTYHDQWISEGLANYSSLLLLEQENPAQFREVMDKYRNDLLSKNKDGEWLRDAGPVTLGQRLVSSHFPNGYEAISYERGTWLFHMLRSMLRDSEAASNSPRGRPSPEEPFFRALRKLRDRYTDKAIGSRELIQVFEEELPRPLWYDSHHKLDWFVDSWIDGTAIPRLETRNVRIGGKAGGTSVSGVIVQKDAPENLITAVPVYGEAASNAMIFLGEVLADGRETSFHLPAPIGVHKIVLDPYQTVLTVPK
ncbi:MAG: M1 family aminopeptidase [Terriglobales bacterium]